MLILALLTFILETRAESDCALLAKNELAYTNRLLSNMWVKQEAVKIVKNPHMYDFEDGYFVDLAQQLGYRVEIIEGPLLKGKYELLPNETVLGQSVAGLQQRYPGLKIILDEGFYRTNQFGSRYDELSNSITLPMYTLVEEGMDPIFLHEVVHAHLTYAKEARQIPSIGIFAADKSHVPSGLMDDLAVYGQRSYLEEIKTYRIQLQAMQARVDVLEKFLKNPSSMDQLDLIKMARDRIQALKSELTSASKKRIGQIQAELTYWEHAEKRVRVDGTKFAKDVLGDYRTAITETKQRLDALKIYYKGELEGILKKIKANSMTADIDLWNTLPVVKVNTDKRTVHIALPPSSLVLYQEWQKLRAELGILSDLDWTPDVVGKIEKTKKAIQEKRNQIIDLAVQQAEKGLEFTAP